MPPDLLVEEAAVEPDLPLEVPRVVAAEDLPGRGPEILDDGLVDLVVEVRRHRVFDLLHLVGQAHDALRLMPASLYSQAPRQTLKCGCTPTASPFSSRFVRGSSSTVSWQ